MKKLPLGIDISKATLDYYAPSGSDQWMAGRSENTVAGIKAMLGNWDPGQVMLIVEPTGTYGDKLLELAHEAGFEIRIANPKTSSQFTEVLGIINKTDANAARVLVEMGKTLKLPIYQPLTPQMKERKQLRSTLNAISRQVGMLKNQIHAMEQLYAPSQTAFQALKNSLEALEKEQDALERALKELSDEEADEFIKYASSVTGIGPQSAQALLVYTNGLRGFENKAQVSKFVGVVPASHQSGSSVYKKGRITKSGPSRLRATLYYAARSAIRFNFACKALYERLRRKGKPHKVAMIAVVNKLLHQVFAVVKSKNEFDNQFYLKTLTIT